MEVSYQEIYDEYIRRVKAEFIEVKKHIDKLYLELKDSYSEGQLIMLLKEKSGENSINFVSKYYWIGCVQLSGSDFFYKAGVETNEMCSELINYPYYLVQMKLDEI